MEINENNNLIDPGNKRFINPLDVRTEGEHNDRLKRWETFGLLNSGLMDTLVVMTPKEIASLTSILSMSIIDVEDIIDKYAIISDYANDLIEIDGDVGIYSKFDIIKGIINGTIELGFTNDDDESED